MNFMVFFGVFAAVFAISFLVGGEDDAEVKNRMSMFASMGTEAEEAQIPDVAKEKKKSNPIFQKIGQIITPKALSLRFERLLEKADLPLRANEFAGMVFLSGMVPGGFLWLVSRNPVIAAAALFGGFGFPFVYLQLKYTKRLRMFNDQMLDTLTMLSNGVKAGYSMVQAMEMVAKESPPPMGTEFGRLVREVSLGVTVEEAMNNLKERVPSDELDLMVTVIMIQRQIGGNLSEILESIANTIRERNKLNGMINALTAQGRMSGLVIGGMPFALLGVLYVINPKYISLLWTYHSGAFQAYYLLIMCVVMELTGFVIINKIITIEV
jgi:tight adherence protein B